MDQQEPAPPVGAIADLQRENQYLRDCVEYLMDCVQIMAGEMDWLAFPERPGKGHDGEGVQT